MDPQDVCSLNHHQGFPLPYIFSQSWQNMESPACFLIKDFFITAQATKHLSSTNINKVTKACLCLFNSYRLFGLWNQIYSANLYIIILQPYCDSHCPIVKRLAVVLIELQPLVEGVLCLMVHDQCVIGEVEAVWPRLIRVADHLLNWKNRT